MPLRTLLMYQVPYNPDIMEDPEDRAAVVRMRRASMAAAEEAGAWLAPRRSVVAVLPGSGPGLGNGPGTGLGTRPESGPGGPGAHMEPTAGGSDGGSFETPGSKVWGLARSSACAVPCLGSCCGSYPRCAVECLLEGPL